MRSRSLATQHDAAVARRLELLSSELAAVRDPDPGPDVQARPARAWRPEGLPHIHAVPDPDDVEEGDLPIEVHPVPAVPTAMVRLPGRHASRRPTAPWADLVPEGLRGRVVLGPGQVAVVAVLVAAGLALACWWLLRSGAHQEVAPLTVSTPPTAPAGMPTPAASSTTGPAPTGVSGGVVVPAKVVVDVTGKVRHPGIVVVRQGARVVDALRAAGGARPGVDLGGLNLARVLIDGEQVVVGQSGQAVPVASAPGGGPSGSGTPPGALVDINTADETTLESLPEIGPVTAAAIIAWRTQHGGFTAVGQLLDVDGIGDATMAKLTPLVTL